MEVTIHPKYEEFICELIRSGRYLVPGEVVSDALTLLQKEEYIREMRRKELQAEIQAGIDQFERGEYQTYTREELHEFFEDIKRRGREELASERASRGG